MNKQWSDQLFRKEVILKYSKFGFLLTRIQGEQGVKNSFKDPSEKWDIEEQTPGMLSRLDWNDSSGVGFITGTNYYRAIDIDDISFDYDRHRDKNFSSDDARNLFLAKTLQLLGLPANYEWLMKSPHGYHIVIRIDDIRDMPETVAYEPNSYYSKGNRISFSRIEFLWENAHLVLPPSENEDKQSYSFVYCLSPKAEPLFVDPEYVESFLNYYCGRCTSANPFPSSDMDNLKLKSITRSRSARNSFEEIGEFGPDIQDNPFWLKSCGIPDSLNRLGVLSFKSGDRDLAVSCFMRSKTAEAYFNLSNLLSHKLINGSIQDLNRFLPRSGIRINEQDRIRAEYINRASRYKAVLFSLSYLRQNEIDGIYQLSWIAVDEGGAAIRCVNWVINPEGVTIPMSVTKRIGFTQRDASIYGVEAKYALSSLYYFICNSKVAISCDWSIKKSTFLNAISRENVQSLIQGGGDKYDSSVFNNVIDIKELFAKGISEYGCGPKSSFEQIVECVFLEDYLHKGNSNDDVYYMYRLFSIFSEKEDPNSTL